MFPVLATAVAAGKSTAVAEVSGKLSEGIAGLFGDTAKDRARKARAEQLTVAALAGDQQALRQLAFDAFEPANGLPGDNRPIDRNRKSPPLTRALSKKGLQLYAQKYGGLPPTLAQYAAELSVPVKEGAPPLLQGILTPAINTITDQALDRAAERSQDALRQYMPLILAAGAIAVLVVVMRRS